MTKKNKKGLEILASKYNTTKEEIINALIFNYRFVPDELKEILEFYKDHK